MTDANKDRAAGIIFKDLTVTLNGRCLLDHISAVAPGGGATVILGPNGAGKTTLLRCLLGETGYQGKIAFVNSRGQPVEKPVIGYVPQQLMTDHASPLRVYEFLALGRTRKPLWLGCSRKNRELGRHYLQLVGAEKLDEKRVGTLSGGELRRVLLAAALQRQPDLLVLDEAEAGVDYQGERLFWQLLDKSRRELGFTLLMVSHNLPLAAHFATYAICIKTRLLAQGPPQKTLTGELLLSLFGIPIHLYPGQCADPGPACPQCGAFGNLPYLPEAQIQDQLAKGTAHGF